ncbi:zinc ribbon domain-containing protein [Streptomyces avermitilis]|uniref:zinc ribbon domain-containing protein n=1 Tax=Streptomyces avermitilis TaxID=33903 RepID=UPI003F4D5B77
MITVNPRNTSRTCPECGNTAKESRPAQETFHCLSCGPHRARRHGGGPQRSTGRAGPPRRQPGIARSPGPAGGGATKRMLGHPLGHNRPRHRCGTVRSGPATGAVLPMLDSPTKVNQKEVT